MKHWFSCGLMTPAFLRWPLPHRIAVAGVWVMFLVAFVWFVGCSFFGKVLNQDECYMYLCCRYYADQPIAMLAFYVGWEWMRLFGDQVISLRLLGVVSYILAALFPVYYFYRRTHNFTWAVFLFTVLLVVIESGRLMFYGWDSGAYVYESALLTVCMFYVDKPSLSKCILTAVILVLMILARIPTAVLGIPVTLWVISCGWKRHRLPVAWLRRAGAYWLLAFVATLIIAVCVMVGTPMAYISSWIPDNIITGHGFRDMLYGYVDWMIYDLNFYWNTYGFWTDSFVCIAFLAFFERKSRNVLGLILLCLVCWRRMTLHQVTYIPWLCLPGGLLLYTVVHNALVRIGRKVSGLIKLDGVKLALIFVFALVPVVGSDRIMMRVTFFYSIPFIMVWLYPWRNGIIRWFLVFMTLPALCYGVYGRVRDLERCQRMDDVLPYHRYIIEYPENPDYITPLKPIVQRLEKEGKKFGSFGEFRYGPVYLFEKEKPYRLNTFHNYYPEETEAVVRDFARHLDALFIQPKDTPALTFYEIQDILDSEGYEPTAVAGSYWVFEKQTGE